MAKIICEKCGTEFKFGIAKDFECCPVCNASLMGTDDFSNEESPSFGEDVVLSENDSFDEDKIDYWWYSITEPGELGDGERGMAHTNCTKCGHFSSAPYPIARTGDYLLIDSRYTGTCDCGNEMKNHILSKRPSDWVDPRQREMWEKDYEHLPKCPTCNSTNIKKISVTSKAASVAMWGLLSRKVHKQWHCNICGSEW